MNYINDKAYIYHYNYLSTEQKKLYKSLLNKYNSYSQKIMYQEYSFNTFKELNYAVISDHPELYYVCPIAPPSGNFYQFLYAYPQEDLPKIDEKIKNTVFRWKNKIIKRPNDLEKILTTVDYLMDHTEYEIDNVHNQNMASVLCFGKAQCSGYSSAFKFLMDLLEIPSIIVLGESEGVPHAWNMVAIDGIFYHLDITWVDGSSKHGFRIYTYLLNSDEQMEADHKWDRTKYPKCPEGIYISSRDVDKEYVIKFKDFNDVRMRIQASLDREDEYISFDFGDYNLDKAINNISKVMDLLVYKYRVDIQLYTYGPIVQIRLKYYKREQ